jgi:hypothetical protein
MEIDNFGLLLRRLAGSNCYIDYFGMGNANRMIENEKRPRASTKIAICEN